MKFHETGLLGLLFASEALMDEELGSRSSYRFAVSGLTAKFRSLTVTHLYILALRNKEEHIPALFVF